MLEESTTPAWFLACKLPLSCQPRCHQSVEWNSYDGIEQMSSWSCKDY
jgi:hypothetical protein